MQPLPLLLSPPPPHPCYLPLPLLPSPPLPPYLPFLPPSPTPQTPLPLLTSPFLLSPRGLPPSPLSPLSLPPPLSLSPLSPSLSSPPPISYAQNTKDGANAKMNPRDETLEVDLAATKRVPFLHIGAAFFHSSPGSPTGSLPSLRRKITSPDAVGNCTNNTLSIGVKKRSLRGGRSEVKGRNEVYLLLVLVPTSSNLSLRGCFLPQSWGG